MIIDVGMHSVLLLIQLILSEISGVISTNGYLAFGYVYMSIAIAGILHGFIRSAYLIFDYVQKVQKDKSFVIQSERIV